MSSFRRKLQMLNLHETQGDKTGAQENLLLRRRLMQAVRSSHDLIAPEAFLAELHYSLRMLRRNPGFVLPKWIGDRRGVACALIRERRRVP